MDGIDKLGGVSNAASLRSTPVAATAPTTPAKAATPAQTADTSATSQAFALLADAAPVDSKKVEAIKSLIAAGAYPIDPQAVAAKMVALDFPSNGDGADA